ncbi:MAG: quinol:cytochrome C oxidoreductase [Chitinophagales bacterium]|nr:quinol:cytochrome C oxidoreductase [Chitinophagales bacterium]
MDQFTFASKHKTVLTAFMIVGLVCLGLTFVVDDELHTRFWTNYLHNSVFFTGIAFMALFTLAAFTTALAGWHTLVKRIWEAYSMFLIPGLILMLVVVLGVVGHLHHLYHWTDAAAVEHDPVLSGKSSFLNTGWYSIGTVVIMGIWIYFAWKIRQISLDEDKNGALDFGHHRRLRIWSAAFLPIAGFSSAAIIWQWIMSIDAHWYSTLFAWYTGASWFCASMALTIMLVSFLKRQGYLEKVTQEHLHDLGKYLFAFSIFWTYLWFSQYMLIWYGNVGEETIYFYERIHNYPVLFYGNLLLNFITPFFILMRNDTKRKYGTLVFVSAVVFFGHWWDFFQMIKPGARLTAMEALAHHGGGHGGHGAEAAHHAVDFAMGFTIPGFLELGTMLGFLALFLFVVFNRLEKASLVPKNDPYLPEALHHHVELHGDDAHH